MPEMAYLWYNNMNKCALALCYQPRAWPLSSVEITTVPIIPSYPGIYKITCTVNNKVYIGSTSDLRHRWYWHKGDLRQNRHHTRHLQYAWNKYGEDAFTFEVLEIVMFAEYMHEREQYWLDYYQAYDHSKGFNHGPAAKAPWLGRKHTDEYRARMSEYWKNRPFPEEARAAAAEWHGSEAGKAWHREHGKKVWEDRKPLSYTCEQCGTSFTSVSNGRVRFCSNNCKSAARRKLRKDDEERQCTQCGETFRCNRYFPTLTCSRSCATELRRVRRES